MLPKRDFNDDMLPHFFTEYGLVPLQQFNGACVKPETKSNTI